MADFYVNYNNFDLNTIPYLEFVRRFASADIEEEISSHQPLRRDGEVVVGRRYGTKLLSFEGYILAPTRTDYEQTVDQLKFRVSQIERPLSFEQAGELRSYTASKDNLMISHIEGGKASVDLSFKASEPFARAGTQIVHDETVTDPSLYISHTFEGTAPVLPVIYATIDSVTGATGKKVRLGNSYTAQGISVTRDWLANDILMIDGTKKIVTVNDIPTDYTGIFPEFLPNDMTATYSDEFTTRTVQVKVLYNRKYL